MKFHDAIEEVRNRVNIVDIIGQYVRLKRTGNNYMGLCPFHNEKTPSFSVSESKQIFRCFGCEKGGNVYTFLQEYEGMTFPEAVKFLAKKVNVSIDDDFKYNNDEAKKKEELFNLYKDVANTYYQILYSDIGKPGLDYLLKRKLTKETIKKFGLGYAPKSYGYVYKLMKNKGYDDKLLFESKLFGYNDKGPYDFFYERVMFPLVNQNGHIVSFQGRILGDGDQKYINTLDSLIYKKSKNLFGINFAKNTHEDYYILCEGNMDVISLNQAGFTNAVASWGTAFTIDQANLIKKRVNKVLLSQDTDKAGIKAIASSSAICESVGIETYVLDYSPYKDADEYIVNKGAEAFKEKLLSPIPTFLFLISVLRKEYNLENAYDYEKYIKTIVDRLAKINNSIIREKYLKDVCRQENLPIVELSKQVEEYLRGNNLVFDDSKRNENIVNLDSSKIVEREEECLFVSSLLSLPYINNITNYIAIDELNNIYCKKLYSDYLDKKSLNEILDSLNSLDDEEKRKYNSIIFSSKDIIDFNDINNVDSNMDKTYIIELIKKIKILNIDNEYKGKENSIEDIVNKNDKINSINNMKIDLKYEA